MIQGQLKVNHTYVPGRLYLFPDALAFTDTRLTGMGRVLMGRRSVVGKLVERHRNVAQDPTTPADLPDALVIPHSQITRVEVSRKVMGMAQGSRVLHVWADGQTEFQFSRDDEPGLRGELARVLGDRLT